MLFLTFSFFTNFGQINVLEEFSCGTTNEELFNFLDNIRSNRDTNTDDYDFTLSEPYVLKVHFWEITDLDESSDFPYHSDYHMNELNAMNAVADLNFSYNKFNIFFKYDGFSEFENDDFYYLKITQNQAFKEFIKEENLYIEGAVNIYLPKKVGYFNNLYNGAGYYLPDNEVNMVVVRLGYVNPYEEYPLELRTNTLLKHEVGHSLSLAHTFQGNEQVTRNPEHLEYNANTHGDRVVDTNATRRMRNTGTDTDTSVYFYDFNTCEYLGGQVVNYVGDVNANDILDIDEVWTYTGEYRVSLTDIETNGHNTGFVENKLQVTGINSNEDIEKIQASLRTPIVEFINTDGDDLSIAIQTNINNQLSVDDTFSYTVIVENISGENITNINLVDSLGNDITNFNGDVNNDGLLNSNEIWSFYNNYQLNYTDFDDALETIISDISVEVSTTKQNGTVNTYNVSKNIRTDIQIPTTNLTVSYQNDVLDVDQDGDFINYTISVSNNGIEPMANIVVNDILIGNAYKQYSFINEQGQVITVKTPLYNPNICNIMSYNSICKYNLTFGQGYRMRNDIQETLDDATTNKLINIGVESLYEPYAGTYYNAGPSNPLNKVLFQRGFDYKFVDCTENTYNQPSDFDEIFTYGNTVYSHSKTERIGSISHLNHTAIIILELDDEPHKCYSNFNRAALSGSVTKFIDNVPNTNVTISPKDSLNINNPSLIPNLNSGLYLIKKNYNDGTTKENLIFKEN